MRDAPNVKLRCKNWANEDPKKGVYLLRQQERGHGSWNRLSNV